MRGKGRRKGEERAEVMKERTLHAVSDDVTRYRYLSLYNYNHVSTNQRMPSREDTWGVAAVRSCTAFAIRCTPCCGRTAGASNPGITSGAAQNGLAAKLSRFLKVIYYSAQTCTTVSYVRTQTLETKRWCEQHAVENAGRGAEQKIGSTARDNTIDIVVCCPHLAVTPAAFHSSENMGPSGPSGRLLLPPRLSLPRQCPGEETGFGARHETRGGGGFIVIAIPPSTDAIDGRIPANGPFNPTTASSVRAAIVTTTVVGLVVNDDPAGNGSATDCSTTVANVDAEDAVAKLHPNVQNLAVSSRTTTLNKRTNA